MKVLVEKFGVSAARLKAVGYGEEQLIVKNDKTPAEQAQNRRVIGKISAVKKSQKRPNKPGSSHSKGHFGALFVVCACKTATGG